MVMSILSVRDLHVSFGGVKAADGVDLDIHPRELVAVIGANGSGKTTFLNLCTGYISPQRGDITFDGSSINGMAPRAITRRGIARAFQIPQLFIGHTLCENVMLAVAARHGIWSAFRPLRRPAYREEALQVLELLSLQEVAHQRTAILPEGQRKLADIAIALALKPRLLLLDEPTSGVSTAEKLGLMDTIVGVLRAEHVTALFVEHDMNVVERYADRVLVWDSGRVIFGGPPAEVLHSADVLERVIGVA
ncbi:MAG: ATP-binding cassette domain-containing protein [Hyphomicrobiales bacterium]|nr:ATP-binding cassette domain-containing protein [Hyphomicrobiales bacterium]